MMRRRLFWMGAVLAGIAIAGLAPPARADFELYIQEYAANGTTVGSAFTYNGSGGPNLFTVSSGSHTTADGDFTFSINGSALLQGTSPYLHLDNFSVSEHGSSTNYLVIGLSATNYSGGAGLSDNLSSIANIGSAVVTLQGFGDTNNNSFGVPSGTTVPPPGNAFTPPLVTSSGAVTTGTITMNSSNSGSGITLSIPGTAFNPSGAYSLTEVSTLSGMSSGQTISYNGVLTVTPAPPGLIVALSGMPVCGLYFWRRRTKLHAA